MSDVVYTSVPEVLAALRTGALNETQAAAWIAGLNAKKVSFRVSVSSGKKVGIRCKGTHHTFGLSLYAVTLAEILRNADALKVFLAENLENLEIRPQDLEVIESAINS